MQLAGDEALFGFLQEFGLGEAGRGRNDAHKRVTVDVHVSQGDEAVEPGVRDLLDDRVAGGAGDGGFQLGHRVGVGAAFDAVGREDAGEFDRDLVLKLASGVSGEIFQGVGVHGRWGLCCDGLVGQCPPGDEVTGLGNSAG